MKLTFVQSGGYAGLVRGVSIDTRELPDEERRRLEASVRESGLLDWPGGGSSPARDARQDQIVIEDGALERTVTFDDTSKPASAAALLKELKARSTPQRLT